MRALSFVAGVAAGGLLFLLAGLVAAAALDRELSR